MCFFIIDNHRTTHNNMKHQGKFKLNGRIKHRTWIVSVLIVCIQHQHCSAGGRSYTESEITWGEKSYSMQMNCSECIISRSSWYWSPKLSSVQPHVSSGWHLFFIGLFSIFGPGLGNERMENTLVFLRTDFRTACRCPWATTCTYLGKTLVLYCVSHSAQSANASLSLRMVPETLLHWTQNNDWISNSS